jgi:Nucleotidyl transferase AbiEii toxin, Type IV TA system
MVYAEKIVTAIARGTLSTRWRDFADIYLLSRRHRLTGSEMRDSLRRVAGHRQVELVPLSRILDGFGPIGRARWAIWRGKQRLEDRLPEPLAEVLSAVAAFADPVISDTARDRTWDPGLGDWA